MKFDFATIMSMAQKGISLLGDGRTALAQVKDAVADGQVALTTDQQAELNALLDKEEAETVAAIADARNAIAEYRAGN